MSTVPKVAALDGEIDEPKGKALAKKKDTAPAQPVSAEASSAPESGRGEAAARTAP